MSVRIVKLTSGEDVLGEVTILGDLYVITDPVGISIVRQPNGQPGVGLTPFPLHAMSDPNQPPKKGYTIDIPARSVVYSYVPAQDFIDNYNQIFGAGIIVPNKQIITG
jgi:hypothetical protein